MKTQARGLIAGAAALALGLWLVAGAGSGGAADEKEVRDAIQKIAEAIEKSDEAGAKKLAATLAKTVELADVMNLMALRSRKGIGVGAEPGKITPDGIEAKLINIGKKALPQQQLDKEADALARLSAVTAAIAEYAQLKAPEKNEGNKKKADWITWTQDMRQASAQLSKAAKAKNAAEVKTTAAKLNSACNNCHGVFRD